MFYLILVKIVIVAEIISNMSKKGPHWADGPWKKRDKDWVPQELRVHQKAILKEERRARKADKKAAKAAAKGH